MKTYYLNDGSKVKIDPDNPLGKGGEGTVYTVGNDPSILLKEYTKRALKRMPDIEKKVAAMVEKKPSLLTYKDLTIIAWPAAVVYNAKKEFVGYLMHRVGAKNNLSHIITPGLQKQKFPDITWKDRVIIAINLSLVMDQIHKNDAVVGDINTSDFFVYPGFEIGVVDTDSFQFESKEGTLYHCNVFTPDYTPPEIIRAQKKTKDIERNPNNDNYGLAILIFQILMNGVHPFSARIGKSLGFDGNAINYCMENEIFPYTTDNPAIRPPKNAMPLLFLPERIQSLFERAFKPHTKQASRPTADEWVSALRELKDSLKRCRRKKHHYYPRHFRRCPLCVREKTKDYDYLLTRYGKHDSQFTIYKDEHGKDVPVQKGKEVFKTLSGSYYLHKKGKWMVKIFKPSLNQKHNFEKRLKALRQSKKLKKLSPYVLEPKTLIYQEDSMIGAVYPRHEPLYKIDTFLNAARIGRLRITEKTKVLIARKALRLFKVLESIKETVEYEQLYVDRNLNLFIPDLTLMGFEDASTHPIRMHPDDYLPQEYYLYHQYMAYLKKKNAETKEDGQKTTAEETPKPVLKGDEASNPNDFAFEESPRHLKDEPEEDTAPAKVESFDHRAVQTIRFHMAIVLHRILANTHPFEGVYNQTKKESSFFIRHNIYLHRDNDRVKDLRDTARVIEEFPPGMQKKFEEALSPKHPSKVRRPSPKAWKKALTRYQKRLRQCRENPRHYFDRSFYTCPLCHREASDTLDAIRQFCTEEKKHRIDYFLSFNMALNKLMLLGVLLALLFIINVDTPGTLLSQVSEVDLTSKMVELSALLRLDSLSEAAGSAYTTLKNIVRTIIG